MSGMAAVCRAASRICVAVVIVAWGITAVAQGAGAVIEGTVVDPQGGILPGVTLTLRNTDTGFTRTAVTEGDGRYRFGERSAPSFITSRSRTIRRET
jgi:hypothetical protein